MAATTQVQDALIDQLPPLAKADLLADLNAGQTPDAELTEALEVTVEVARRTGLDGDLLYAEVQKEIARNHGIPNWTLTAYEALTRLVRR